MEQNLYSPRLACSSASLTRGLSCREYNFQKFGASWVGNPVRNPKPKLYILNPKPQTPKSRTQAPSAGTAADPVQGELPSRSSSARFCGIQIFRDAGILGFRVSASRLRVWVQGLRGGVQDVVLRVEIFRPGWSRTPISLANYIVEKPRRQLRR